MHPFKYRQRNASAVDVNATSSYHRSANLLSNDSQGTLRKFRFKKALIVTKLSRYEFEQHKNPKLTISELERMLRDRGTDYDGLIQIHKAHKEFEARVADSFKQFGVDVKLANR